MSQNPLHRRLRRLGPRIVFDQAVSDPLLQTRAHILERVGALLGIRRHRPRLNQELSRRAPILPLQEFSFSLLRIEDGVVALEVTVPQVEHLRQTVELFPCEIHAVVARRIILAADHFIIVKEIPPRSVAERYWSQLITIIYVHKALCFRRDIIPREHIIHIPCQKIDRRQLFIL